MDSETIWRRESVDIVTPLGGGNLWIVRPFGGGSLWIVRPLGGGSLGM